MRTAILSLLFGAMGGGGLVLAVEDTPHGNRQLRFQGKAVIVQNDRGQWSEFIMRAPGWKGVNTGVVITDKVGPESGRMVLGVQQGGHPAAMVVLHADDGVYLMGDVLHVSEDGYVTSLIERIEALEER